MHALDEIVSRYSQCIGHNRVYFGQCIPDKKLRNALRMYQEFVHEETLYYILSFDMVIFRKVLP